MDKLLDLCRLNLMEEHVAESPAPDRDATMKAIEWKKRDLVVKIINEVVEDTDAGREG